MVYTISMITAWSIPALAPKIAVKPGKQACYEIQLPTCWHTVADHACFEVQRNFDVFNLYHPEHVPPPVSPADDYYHYQRSQTDPGILILSASSRQYTARFTYPNAKLFGNPELASVPGAMSVEHWAIRFTHPPEIRLATEAEYSDAIELKTSQKSGQSPTVGNRTYKPSGPLIMANYGVRESVDSRYVALISSNYGGGLGLDELLNVFGNVFSRKSSHSWVDVFEASSGQRVIGLSGNMADAALGGLQWIEGNRFIFPWSNTLDRFEICEAEAARQNPTH